MMFLNRERINKDLFVGRKKQTAGSTDCSSDFSVYDSRGKGSLEEEECYPEKERMDFDKQFGSVASAPVVKRGRGFTEKPMAQRNPMPRQNTVRSTQQKVTPKTTLYLRMSACS